MSFTPVIRNSKSIPKSLIEFAKDRNISPKLLDFELLSHETFLKRVNEEEFTLVEDVTKITETDIKNPLTEIIQEYSIQIKPANKNVDTVQLALSADKLKTKAFITIKKASIFTKELYSLKYLKERIWNKKLKAGLLINIFEDKLDKQLEKLLQIVPYDKALSKDVKFTVASTFSPSKPIDARLEKFYEKKEEDSESIITAIKKGECIAKYIFAKDGESARACDGKFVIPNPAIIKEKEPTIDETITSKKFENYIEYFASKNGYVIYFQDTLTISNTLKLKEANFKTSALIEAGDENDDISVHIQHAKTHSEDAIGSGVKIDVKELNVDGSIASNVDIKTQSLHVDAQTHRNSKMQVTETAKIKLHRGDLATKEAHIDILESGKITASQSAHMKQTLGGIIISPIVTIDEMMSNTTVIASELIEIKAISGENNKLIIDPDAIPAYHEQIVVIKEKVEDLKQNLAEQKKLLEEKIKEHGSKIERIKTFKKRVLKATKEGKTPMKQDVIRIKQYKRDSQKFQLQKQDLENNTTLEALEEQLDVLYNKDLHAKIQLKASYDGHTKVSFISPKTKEELTFMPEGTIPSISLKVDSEGNRSIYKEH